jgi:hypothetical protein
MCLKKLVALVNATESLLDEAIMERRRQQSKVFR